MILDGLKPVPVIRLNPWDLSVFVDVSSQFNLSWVGASCGFSAAAWIDVLTAIAALNMPMDIDRVRQSMAQRTTPIGTYE